MVDDPAHLDVVDEVRREVSATGAPVRVALDIDAGFRLGRSHVGPKRSPLHDTAEALGLGMGKVAQPLRVAITGTQVSPDIGHTVYLAGRDGALARIDAALAKIPA